jgi:hypothetical protein
MPRIRLAFFVLSAALFATALFAPAPSPAQSAVTSANSAPHPAPRLPGQRPVAAPSHARSFRQYWQELRAYTLANAPDASVMIRRADRVPDPHAIPDGGPVGNKSFTPYFSGADSVISFPSYNLWGGLQRQSNCSLTEQLIGNFQILQSIPDYEQYLHTLAGLTTTPDKFPNGCDDPPMAGSLNQVIYLGKVATGTNAGATIGADFPFSTVNTIHVPVVSTTNRISETYPVVGYNIGGMIAADFNGDGNLDIAVTDTADEGASQQQISILIANGDGTFQAPAQISVPGGIYGLVAGDFNGDGKIDLVASAFSTPGKYELLFFAGKGNGTFAAPVSTDTGATEYLVATPLKLTSSGHLDIAGWNISQVSGNFVYQLALFENNGSAVFTPVLSSFDGGGFLSPISAGDLNGDGKIDLVTLSFQANTATVLQGNGDGTFTPKNTYATVYTPDSAIITDLDGDGVNDLYVGLGGSGFFGPVYSDEGSSFGEALLGNGDFTFSTPPALVPYTANVIFNAQSIQSFAVSDFNNDGHQDIAVLGENSSTRVATVSTFIGNGTGGFSNGTTVSFSGLLAGSYGDASVIAVPFTTSGAPGLIATGNDISNSLPAIQTATSNGSDSFTLGKVLDTSASVTSIVAADFNGDGKTDLAFITNDQGQTTSDALYVALGNGTGGFQTPTILNSQVTFGGFVTSADINGDGKPDLVVIQSTGYTSAANVLVYINQGTTFAAPVTFSVPDNSPLNYAMLADFTGDGKLDLGLIGFNGSEFTSNFYLYTGNKTANFTFSGEFDLGDNGAVSGAVVDVNHDGILDLVVDGCCGATSPSLLLGKTAGTFYPVQPFLVPSSAEGVQAINLGNANYPGIVFGVTGGPVPLINHYAAAPSVTKAATTITAVGGGTVSQGQDLEFEVTVSETAAAGQPSGTVTLSNGSTVLQTTYLSDTNGNITYLDVDTTNLTPGSYTYTINYLGDNFNLPSSTTVSFKIIYNTALVFTITPNPVPFGEKVTLKGVVTRSPGSGYPTGEVAFFDNGGNSEIGTAKMVNGVGSLTESTAGLPAGTYSVQAGYYGDPTDGDALSPLMNLVLVPKGLNGTTTTLVLSPNPITTGQNAKLTATVINATGSGTPTGSVDFTAQVFGSKIDLGTIALNGSGVASISAPTTGLYASYFYEITATYKGNKTDYTSSDTLQVLIRPTTSVSVTVNPATVTPPASVTLSAQVYTQEFSPTGSVTFYADGVAIGTSKLNGSGHASFSASSAGINPGTYSITGTYTGDAYNGASTSPPVTVTVQ